MGRSRPERRQQQGLRCQGAGCVQCAESSLPSERAVLPRSHGRWARGPEPAASLWPALLCTCPRAPGGRALCLPAALTCPGLLGWHLVLSILGALPTAHLPVALVGRPRAAASGPASIPPVLSWRGSAHRGPHVASGLPAGEGCPPLCDAALSSPCKEGTGQAGGTDSPQQALAAPEPLGSLCASSCGHLPSWEVPPGPLSLGWGFRRLRRPQQCDACCHSPR